MSGFFAACRFVVGIAMVVGGAALAAPLAGTLTRCFEPRPGTVDEPRGDRATPVLPGEVSEADQVVPRAGEAGAAVPDGPVATHDPAALPRTDYVPPHQPEGLPPVAEEISAGTPAIARTYRSALDVPPPPLLDVAGSPPPVGWVLPATVAPPLGGREPEAARVQATHRVADGDDLEGIASRFYGHPTAAGAILAANRDRITDPALLPIGVELRLPPAGAIALPPVAGESGTRAIEPRAGGGHSPQTPPPAQAASWLGPAVSPPVAGAPRPGTIIVTPGETLTTIAVRWYQDPAFARRLWEANRDRLRSPDLVVPGMELRMP